MTTRNLARSAIPVAMLVLLAACGGAEPSAEPSPDASVDAAAQAKVLRALPYAGWAPLDADSTPPAGVVHHDRERAFAGLNLFSPRTLAEAYLMDMDGRIVHRWSAEGGAWHHVELAAGGDLMAIVKDAALLRLDRGSRVVWSLPGRFHHDLAETTGGDFYTFVNRERMVTLHGTEIPVLDDLVVLVSAGGELLRETSLLDLFPDRFSRRRVEMIRKQSVERGYYDAMAARRPGEIVIPPDTHADLFHLNSVEVLSGDLRGVAEPGDLLISIRNMNTIAVLDPETLEVRWAWGRGELQWQHHPTPLENGHVLIFDNGVSREFSRLLEVDPASGRIVWEFRGDPPESFYSKSRGASQRLPNGNTLITESDAGRVFEIDPEGRVVWDYWCELIRGSGERLERSTFYRLERITNPARFGVADLAG